MPAAASYLRANDYNTLKFRPFDLPVNDIAKTIMAKTQYWNEGASRVKARYEDALGLTLTNPHNQQIKKDYINKSEDMLKSMSSQNLGNPDVQQAGIGIFKNLFEDEGIVYDDQYTKHLGKVQSDYYSLLKRDPKKASGTNLAYAMEDAEAFRNDPDRTSGKTYFNRRREYTPYYDPADDIDAAMKHCKASSTTSQSPTKTLTGYDIKTSEKGISRAQATACFQEGLTGQAKQQLNINGYMAFKDNKPGLAAEYSKYLHRNAQALISDRTSVSVKMADLLKKKQVGQLSPEDAQAYEQYQAMDKAYGSEINNATDTINRLIKGDYSPLDKDYAGISGMMYTNMKTSSFGNAFSYEEYSKLMTADPVQMLNLKQQFEATLQDDNQDFQLHRDAVGYTYDVALQALRNQGALETAKANGKKKAGEEGYEAIGVNPQEMMAIGQVEPSLENYGHFVGDVSRVTNSINANNETIKNRLMSDKVFKETVGKLAVTGRPGVTVGDLSPDEFVRSDAFKQFAGNAEENLKLYPDMEKWRQENVNLKVKATMLDYTSKRLEAKIPKEWLDESYLGNIDGAAVSNGPGVGAREMKTAIDGNAAGRVQIITGKSGLGSGTQDDVKAFIVDGKRYNATITGIGKNPDFNNIYRLYKDVIMGNKTNIEKVNNKRKELYSNSSYDQSVYFNIDDQTNPAVVQLKTIIKEMAKGDVKEEGYISGYDPKTGDVIVGFPGLSNTNEKDLKMLSGAGFGTSVVERVGDGKTNPNLFKLKGMSGFNETGRLGLDGQATENAVLLKNVADVSINDKAIKTGQVAFTLPVPIKNDTRTSLKNWRVEAVKQFDGQRLSMEYILYDENDSERGRENDPFKIMKRVADITKK